MAINLCGQMDLFSMLGDIGGKPYNNMTISADMPSAFSGKTENEIQIILTIICQWKKRFLHC